MKKKKTILRNHRDKVTYEDPGGEGVRGSVVGERFKGHFLLWILGKFRERKVLRSN